MNFSSFIGQAKTAIDEKGRSSFPREFRRVLAQDEGEDLVLAFGPQRSLILFVRDEYEKYVASLEARRKTPQTEMFRRKFKASAHQFGLDGQNRVMLPKMHLEYAGLNGDVLYVARSGKSLELWNPAVYQSLHGFNTPEDYSAFDAGFYDDGFGEDSHDR